MRKIFLLILLFFSYNNGVLADNNGYKTAEIDGYTYYVSEILLDGINRASWCNSFGAKLLTAKDIDMALCHEIISYNNNVENANYLVGGVNAFSIYTADKLNDKYLTITCNLGVKFIKDNEGCYNGSIKEAFCTNQDITPAYFHEKGDDGKTDCVRYCLGEGKKAEACEKACAQQLRIQSVFCEGLQPYTINGVSVCYRQSFGLEVEYATGYAVCRKPTPKTASE